MADDHLSFTASPGGANWIDVTWIIPGAGMLGRDKKVSRAEATHAHIVERGGANEGERTVSVVEANAYVAELERLQAERQAAVDAAAAERDRRLVALSSVCPHCDLPREYEGTRQLQVGSVGAELVFGELLSVSNAVTHWYVCRQCGSVEVFADGVVRHPLAGNR